MKIELIKASVDCSKGATGFCYHYPTIWFFLLIGVLLIGVYIYSKFIKKMPQINNVIEENEK